MSVVRIRVQKVIIKESNPLAEFVSCNNHSLNLEGVRAASASVSAVIFLEQFKNVLSFLLHQIIGWMF